MSHRLLILDPDRTMEVQFDHQITIGRDAFNALTLQDPEVSRSHAIIFEQEGEVVLKDLKSRNGCYVRGERTSECVLRPGDEIIMGRTVILFEPPEDGSLAPLLSRRGRYLLERRAAGERALERPAAAQSFTREQMESDVERMLNNPEGTSFFSLTHAVQLIRAFYDMDEAPDAGRLFDCAVSHALAMLGGHRGTIMEIDADRKHLKVRSLMTVEETDAIRIAPAILRVVIGSAKCLVCTDTRQDRRFASLAEMPKPVHSFVAVPIAGREELYGLLYLDSQNPAVRYDYTALRSLYMIAAHLAALLRKRPMHFARHASLTSPLPARP